MTSTLFKIPAPSEKRRAFINPHRNSFLIHIFSNRFQMRQNYESLEHVVSYFTTLECCTWVRETFWEWHKWFRQLECANIIIRNSKQVDLIYKEWRRRKGSKLFCERIPYNTHFLKVWDQKKIVKKNIQRLAISMTIKIWSKKVKRVGTNCLRR